MTFPFRVPSVVARPVGRKSRFNTVEELTTNPGFCSYEIAIAVDPVNPQTAGMLEGLFPQFRAFLETPEPAGLGPGPRSGVMALAELNVKLDAAFRKIELSAERQSLVRAVIYLWHDHLDASHDISQGIENPDGSLVHALMHRREPDFWNSKYWWRRVGDHPAFTNLATRVISFLNAKGDDGLAKKLAPGSKWNPAAFVDECEAATSSQSDARISLLQEIQRIETETVLEYFLAP